MLGTFEEILSVALGVKMKSDSPRVFLSYHRESSGWAALMIKRELELRGADVFVDIERINSGRFETVILNEIGRREHFVALLTSSRSTCLDPKIVGLRKNWRGAGAWQECDSSPTRWRQN